MSPLPAAQLVVLAAVAGPAAGLSGLVGVHQAVTAHRNASQPGGGGAGHFWPHNFGPVPSQRHVTAQLPPANLAESLAWTWWHPAGRYHTVVLGGPVIDSQENLYLASIDGVRKFSPEGETLWHYQPPEAMTNAVTLMGGAVFGTSEGGHAFALDLGDGTPLWLTKPGSSIGPDTAYPMATSGLFVMGVDSPPGGGNSEVVALNATTGQTVWTFRPPVTVWNFAPITPEGETILFMDLHGGAHRLSLHDGSVLWYTPVADVLSFSDGGLILGDNGFAYTCSNLGDSQGNEGTRGVLRAFEVDDGHLAWEQDLPQPCNSWPAVGPVGRAEPSVVVTIGSFPGMPGGPQAPKHTGILAFDARSGELQWQFQAPAWVPAAARGDAEGLLTRIEATPERTICLPAAWSAPLISGDGTVLAGNMNGLLYSVRGPPSGSGEHNASAPHVVDFATSPGVQVSTFDAGGAFLHGGVAAWAPGMMAMASCDTLFVFKHAEQ